ncbi:MAG TPA: hypothetical protein VHB25_19990 [Gemmatimonadaceae bacterium]|nr:hypothetical protein [Gemmatimonadaceae bacterium]
MPVTAKLSRRVYEQLGDDVVNAIVDWFNQVDATYRGDLREMNDLNFARFDAKLGERLAEFEAKVERRLAEFEAKIERRLADFESRFERRLLSLESRIEQCVTRTEFEQRLAALETRLTHRIFYASAATFLAQLIALITLFRMFGSPH